MKKIKHLITPPALLFLSISSALASSDFWKSDLNVNLTNITKRAGVDNFTNDTATPGEPWAGIGPNGEAAGTANLYYSRIPAMTITEDNKMVVMFDLRWNRAYDQDRIDPGVAVSSDGGHTWVKKTAWSFSPTNHPTRRAMDPTILHNPIDNSIYVMHGTWSMSAAQWYGGRQDHFNSGSWAATIHKSTDGGLTWEKNAEFSKFSNLDIFSKVTRQGQPTIGFLGGVGSGIVMQDGTLVFPIQTAHNNGIATTIMYSKDNGKTWEMPEINNPIAPNQSSLENMVFEIEPGKLVMTGRGNSRWAYSSTDMGKSWQLFTPVNGLLPTTSQPTQGSSIYVTLPNGRKVLLISKPDGNNDSWRRGNITLWMLDAKNPAHKHKVTVIRPGSGNAAGAGYSSLAYKEGNLFVAFEDDGDISVKNLTEHIAEMERVAVDWELKDEISVAVDNINALPYLNQAQKDELVAKMRRANDSAIAQSFVINEEMNNLKNNSEALDLLAKEVTKALPSQRAIYESALNYVKKVTTTTDTTYLDYNGIQSVYDNLYATYLALLNTNLDFSKYVKAAEKFNEYNTDILYRTFDNVFVHYDSGTKHNNLSLGLNTAITDNLRAGVFFEFRNKNRNSQQFGFRAKYETGNHQISGFVRYRGVKHNEFIERNKNIDGYLNYAYRIQLDDKLSISPSVGAYISRSSRTLIDEDVAINKRTVYAGDIGLNIAYKLGSMNAYIRPNVAFINDGATLAQSNDATNTHKIKSDNVIYAVTTGLEKRFANGFAVGSNLKLQRYGSQSTETNFGLDFSYQW